MGIKNNLQRRKDHYIILLFMTLLITFSVNAFSGTVGHDAVELESVMGGTTDTVSNHLNTLNTRLAALETANLPNRVTVLEGNSPLPVTWTQITSGYLGTLPASGSTTYSLPGSIPADAKEILIYTYVRKGRHSDGPEVEWDIWTEESSNKYLYKFGAFRYDNNAWTYNSDNYWLPVTTDRTIRISLATGSMSGYWGSEVTILGYR